MTSTNYTIKLFWLLLGREMMGRGVLFCSTFFPLKIICNDWWYLILINKGEKQLSNFSTFLFPPNQIQIDSIADVQSASFIFPWTLLLSTYGRLPHICNSEAVFIRPWGTLGLYRNSGTMENFWINSLDFLPLCCNNGDLCSICSHLVLQWGYA